MEIQDLKGRMRELFGIPNKLLPKLKYQIKDLYVNPRYRNIAPELLHKIAINLFASDYFPIVSRNIRIDKFTFSVIMGGIAYNMNVPFKMPFLKVDTDDIDLKIYTTDINYLEKNEKSVNKVLAVLRFTVIIICMYAKQILELIKQITSEFSSSSKANAKTIHKNTIKQHKSKFKIHQKKYTKNKGQSKGKGKISNKLTKKYGKPVQQHKQQHKQHKQQHKQINQKKPQNGGAPVKFGSFLNDYNILVQIKKKNENNVNEIIEKLDLTTMSYSDIFSTIMAKIDDPDVLVTNKISYNIQYADGKIHNKFRSITFSDTKIIFPNKENPAFYAQYLMNNPKDVGKKIDTLVNEYIPIDKIIETKPCGNNCKFSSVKTLLLDTTLMLSYADLLAYEKLETTGKVLVPVGFLFKYYKYLTKYLRLFVIKKYANGTLNDNFLNQSKQLWTYVMTNLKINTSQVSETDEINISYKKILNEFHQNLFINQSLLNNYPDLKESINEYSNMVYYINNSRALFKDLDSKSKHVGETLESITIQMAEHELSKSSSKHFGGSNIYSGGNVKRFTLQSATNYDDLELDNLEKNQKITKQIIISKVNNLIHDEITTLNITSKYIFQSSRI